MSDFVVHKSFLVLNFFLLFFMLAYIAVYVVTEVMSGRFTHFAFQII